MLKIFEYLFCQKNTKRLKLIVIQNLKANKHRNNGSIVMIILTIMLMVLVRCFNIELPKILIEKI